MGVDQIWLGSDSRPSETLTDGEIAFIASRDSFYMASVSETGWPYVQHRGGNVGFLKVIDQRTMAFADYRGNRQYISAGNLAANERACLFLMDYVRQRQLDYRLIKELWALAAIGSPSDLPTSGMTTVATGSDRSGTRTGSSTIVA